MKVTGDLIIETTRNCNLKCGHCLRGDKEDKTIKAEYMVDVIKQYEYINTITFTGGEPALNPQAINAFIDICKKYNVGVGNFYIATNGTIASDRFMRALVDLYLLCDDNEVSSLVISNDEHHEYETKNNEYDKLNCFRFTNMRYDGVKPTMINEGYYADNYGDGRYNEPESFDYIDIEDFNNGNLGDIAPYLNCKGNIILGCDWSYKNQEHNILCKASESIHHSLKDHVACAVS